MRWSGGWHDAKEEKPGENQTVILFISVPLSNGTPFKVQMFGCYRHGAWAYQSYVGLGTTLFLGDCDVLAWRDKLPDPVQEEDGDERNKNNPMS